MKALAVSLAAVLAAGVGCSSQHDDPLIRATAMPKSTADGAQIWVGVRGPLRQSDIYGIRKGCGGLAGFDQALPAPSLVVVTTTSLGPAVVTPIEACLRRLPFVRIVQGP